MKKDVLISIAGLHYERQAENGEGEPIEIITPASYYLKNGKHYIIYEEMMEGMTGSIKNTVKITEDHTLEINKSGLATARMIFEKGKIYVTNYQTPYGEMLVGIHTKHMQVDVQEDTIDVNITYALDVNGEPLSECELKVNVRSVG